MLSFYIYAHGTTVPIVNVGVSFFKYAAGTFSADQFTRDAALKLIPINHAPAAALRFLPIFQNYTPAENQFYLQWPGDLGEVAWKTAAKGVVKKMKEMIEAAQRDGRLKKDEKVVFNWAGHSHGGTLARYVAKKFLDYPNVEFHVVS